MPRLNEDFKTICEAVGCKSKATISLVLPVGQKGRIPVYVCYECSRIFQDLTLNSINNQLEKSQHSESVVERPDHLRITVRRGAEPG